MSKAENQEQEELERSLGPRYVPGPHDVVCKRGRKAYVHNAAFRNLLVQHVPSYMRVSRRAEKTCIIMAVVDLVRERGSFVRYCKKRKCWFDIGDYRSREKVGHSFRDVLAKGESSKWTTKTVEDDREDQGTLFRGAMARTAKSISRTSNVANNAREMLGVARGVTTHQVPQMNHEGVDHGFGVSQTSPQKLGPRFGTGTTARVENLGTPNTREGRGATVARNSETNPQKVGPWFEAGIMARGLQKLGAPNTREERASVSNNNRGATTTRVSQTSPQNMGPGVGAVLMARRVQNFGRPITRKECAPINNNKRGAITIPRLSQTIYQRRGPEVEAVLMARRVQNFRSPNASDPVNKNNRGATIPRLSQTSSQKVGLGFGAVPMTSDLQNLGRPDTREERAPVDSDNDRGPPIMTRVSQRNPQSFVNQRAPAMVQSTNTNGGVTFIRVSPAFNAPQRASTNKAEAHTVVQSNINNTTSSTPRKRSSNDKRSSKPHVQTTSEETIDNEGRTTTTMTTTTRVTRTETITVTTVTARTRNTDTEAEEEQPQECNQGNHRPTVPPNNVFSSRL